MLGYGKLAIWVVIISLSVIPPEPPYRDKVLSAEILLLTIKKGLFPTITLHLFLIWANFMLCFSQTRCLGPVSGSLSLKALAPSTGRQLGATDNMGICGGRFSGCSRLGGFKGEQKEHSHFQSPLFCFRSMQVSNRMECVHITPVRVNMEQTQLHHC